MSTEREERERREREGEDRGDAIALRLSTIVKLRNVEFTICNVQKG